MPRLTLATLASTSIMGQQNYESAVVTGARGALDADWTVRHEVVRTLRSPLDGTVRLPGAVLRENVGPLRAAAGRWIYRGADVAHRMDLRIPPAADGEVLTIHDVVSWRFDDEGTPPRDVRTEVRRARTVICPSEFSADETAELFGIPRPVVIHNGIDPAFASAQPLDAAGLAGLGIEDRFVLAAGGSTARKNLAGLADAWRRLSPGLPDTQLVLLGPPNARRNRLFAELPRVVLPGRVSSETLHGLVAAAAVLVVPSVYEGFGLPALEAMAAGTAVVAVARSALPEVCGDAAILTEPDGDAIAEGLASALAAGPVVDRMIALGRARAAEFTWTRSLAAHADVWRRAAEG